MPQIHKILNEKYYNMYTIATIEINQNTCMISNFT